MTDELEMMVAGVQPGGRPTLYRVWRAARLVGVIKVVGPYRFQPMAVSQGRWHAGPKLRSRPKALAWLNDDDDARGLNERRTEPPGGR